MKYKFSRGWSRFGSQMGRDNYDSEPDLDAKFYLQYVPFTDYAYDPGGAYWGFPANLYIAFADGTEEEQRCFVRANSREQAKAEVRKVFKNSKFWR